ncbi:DUF881 domain-containing protein [Neobacillus terrae]|uniref:DUF881 domain-containing protein n=1 Tax=Neobacillus terrae TaxID=3034837 RepID=UPI00140748CB|nr:DUF881 domain-containing protein [Neobacillus terrae]NHM29705.1 DUF881 domain-containing protein [Neobacillus terrae]
MNQRGKKTVKKLKVKGNHVILSLVCLVLGYMIAFSYHLTQEENQKKTNKVSGKQYEETLALRNELIDQEETNRNLEKELKRKQNKVLENEKSLSKEDQINFNLAEDAEKYRKFLGKVKVKGKGVKIKLDDGDYNPDEKNVNNYLVHEFHIFKVINELYISGASAVAINGQRLSSHSYIVCNGPVITVDGYQHPAPFVITAIGDPDVLSSAINLTGGVKDQLVNDNIVFTLEQDEIVLDPILGN